MNSHRNEAPRTERPTSRHPLRVIKYLLVTLLVGALGAAFALDSSKDKNVLEGLQSDPDQFSTFLSLVQAAGEAQTLSGQDPITVFAPTNKAFDQLDPAVLEGLQTDQARATDFVKGLILSGAHPMSDLEGAGANTPVPLSGKAYTAEGTGADYSLNGVRFSASNVDKTFSNGVVHVTDQVILPEGMAGQAGANAAGTAAGTGAAGTAATDQATTTQPGTQPGAQPGATAPAAPGAQTPGTAEPTSPNTAYVRVAQLSPELNLDLVLTPKNDAASLLNMGDLAYGSVSGYTAVDAGDYVINATAPSNNAALFEPKNETFRADDYYTIVVTGLQVPDENAGGNEGGGFGAWLRNLFGGGNDRDALAMKVTTYRDDVRTDAGANNSRVRIIDAAPGSPEFDVEAIKANGDHDVIAKAVKYGDDTGAKALPDDIQSLQVTAAGSSVVARDLTGELPLPHDSTIFIIGTSFEDVPFDVLVLTNGAGAESVNAAGQAGGQNAGQGTGQNNNR